MSSGNDIVLEKDYRDLHLHVNSCYIVQSQSLHWARIRIAYCTAKFLTSARVSINKKTRNVEADLFMWCFISA
jgi:hypothetical protein